MSDDPRIALIEGAFEAFQSRDAEAVISFVHPEMESRVASPLMNAGTRHGVEGFAAMASAWEEAFGSVRYDIRGFELVDDRNVLVAVHQDATGAGSGVPVELDVFFLIEIEGERAVRLQIHAERESALAAA